MQHSQSDDIDWYASHGSGRVIRNLPSNAAVWAYSCTKAVPNSSSAWEGVAAGRGDMRRGRYGADCSTAPQALVASPHCEPDATISFPLLSTFWGVWRYWRIQKRPSAAQSGQPVTGMGRGNGRAQCRLCERQSRQLSPRAFIDYLIAALH